MRLSFHLTFFPPSAEKKKKKPLAYFQRTLLVIHLLSRLRRTKADPRRYEKWPEPGECHSGRRIILAFFKKKKKKLRESLLLMNSIKAKLQRKRFSAKIIQHGAKLRAARWPKVEGSSQFQNPDLELPGLSLLVYLIPCVFLN